MCNPTTKIVGGFTISNDNGYRKKGMSFHDVIADL
jgi:hypothetical protein